MTSKLEINDVQIPIKCSAPLLMSAATECATKFRSSHMPFEAVG